MALENNQIRAAEAINHHIVKYQNNYVSSYLFRHNLLHMMSLGINLDELMCSHAFEYEFEFDEWPSTHPDDSDLKKAYNGSIFNLR